MVHCMNDRTGTEKEAGFEKSVGKKMEKTGRICADPEAEHHVPKLGNRGVCQHSLDIVLGDCYGSSHKRGHGTDKGDHGKCVWRENDKDTTDKIYTGGNHRRSMDQGRNRCRAFHGVRKPGMKRKLGRLANAAHEQQDTCRGQPCLGHVELTVLDMIVNLLVAECMELGIQDKDTKPHADITDTVCEKRFFLGVCSTVFVEVEPDKKIGGQTDKLPEYIDGKKVVGKNDTQH